MILKEFNSFTEQVRKHIAKFESNREYEGDLPAVLYDKIDLALVALEKSVNNYVKKGGKTSVIRECTRIAAMLATLCSRIGFPSELLINSEDLNHVGNGSTASTKSRKTTTGSNGCFCPPDKNSERKGSVGTASSRKRPQKSVTFK